MKFRKKPVIVEAVQWFPGVNHSGVGVDSTRRLTDFCSVAAGSSMRDLPAYYVTTIHGQRAFLAPGDWILPEPMEGRFYPCKPDVFANTYTPVLGDECHTEADTAYCVVPKDLPFEVLGEAALDAAFGTGNPKHVWDYLLQKVGRPLVDAERLIAERAWSIAKSGVGATNPPPVTPEVEAVEREIHIHEVDPKEVGFGLPAGFWILVPNGLNPVQVVAVTRCVETKYVSIIRSYCDGLNYVWRDPVFKAVGPFVSTEEAWGAVASCLIKLVRADDDDYVVELAALPIREEFEEEEFLEEVDLEDEDTGVEATSRSVIDEILATAPAVEGPISTGSVNTHA